MSINSPLRLTVLAAFSVCCASIAGCGASSSNSDSDDGAGSEIATGVVSGALNNSAGTKVGLNELPREPAKTRFDWLLEQLNPIGTAWAATWSCTGGSLTPTFNGPGNYAYAPLSCTIGWGNGKQASATWSGTFNLNYGSSCDATHPFMQNQAGNCSMTRTTATGGNTRTLTGPNGSSYAVTHDTNGQGTGWDSAVVPSPNDNGIDVVCGATGCDSGLTLTIHGSQLTGTVTPASGSTMKWWDHTVSTADNGITVTGTGTSRSVSGTVVVQHNLAKFTSTTTFMSVKYGDANCCFPTGGTASTTFSKGPHQGKTESLTFGTGTGCGEAILTRTDGMEVAFTLQHCI